MNEVKDLIPQEITAEGASIIKVAEGLVVANQGSYDIAGSIASGLKDKEKDIDLYFDPKKAVARAGWQLWVDAQKQAKEPIAEARKILNKKLIGYENEQEKIRIADEAKAKAVAEKVAKEQREALEAQGIPEEVIAEAVVEPEAIIVAPTIKKSGATVDNWTWEMDSFEAFALWCVKNSRLDLLAPDLKVLNKEVKSGKGKLKIDGLKQVNKKYKRN